MKSDREEAERVMRNASLLASMEEVAEATSRMANEISEELKSSLPIVVSLMNGGLVPTAMILPKLDFLLETDYLHPTRYNDSTKGGELEWIKGPPQSFSDRTILLVDDILDNGLTLQRAVEECVRVGSQKIYTAVLVKKHVEQRDGLQTTDFFGLHLPDHYLFGCGMDYKRYLRNAPGIFAVLGIK